MEDRCVVCGDVIPEGGHVCETCKIAWAEAPCKTCTERSETCHIYCRDYLGYYNARKRARAIEQAKKNENGYFVKKSLKKKRAFFIKKKEEI